MIDKQIKFDEKYVNEVHGITELYFYAPKEILCGKYPEAISAEIRVEFPTDKPRVECATVMISPTVYVEEDDGYLDSDWCDMDVSHDVIEELMKLAGY